MGISVIGLIPWYEGLNELDVTYKVVEIIHELVEKAKWGVYDKKNVHPVIKITPRIRIFNIFLV